DPPERSRAKQNVHADGSKRTDEHRAFPANFVRQQTVNDLAKSIGKKGCRDDLAHVRLGVMKFLANRFVGNRKIVPAHVERRVQEADKSPIQPSPTAKAKGVLWMSARQRGNGFHELLCAKG